MLRQCCKCQRIWHNERWVFPRLSQLQNETITHGYCDECYRYEIGRIQRRKESAAQPAAIARPAGAHWLSRLWHIFQPHSPS